VGFHQENVLGNCGMRVSYTSESPSGDSGIRQLLILLRRVEFGW
jgi:hypothetical protein